MKRYWVFSVVLLTLASGGEAQERPPAPTPTRVRERTAHIAIPRSGTMYYLSSRRGMMGVTVSIEPEESDSIGALVDAVTPAGPAFKAGIRSGDVISNFNGKSLVALTRETRKSSPGIVLVELLARMTVGDTARVEYRRGTTRRTAAIILEAMPEMAPVPDWSGEPPSFQGPDGLPKIFVGEVPGSRMGNWEGPGEGLFFRMRFADIELAPMNAGLGQYFGVNEGVLVINVADGSDLNLKAGDVITAVAGRKVLSPNHFFRILSSYDSTEPLRLDIMRLKRRESVTGKLNRE